LDQRREPILNVPAVVVALLAVLGVLHFVRTYVLSDMTDATLVWTLAFVPARYDTTILTEGVYPGGTGAEIWTFVTYSLLHADWTHYGFNAVSLLAFGTPVARRFGAGRFLAFFAVTVAAGALAYLVMHAGDRSPLVGASAGISGMMGAAARFAFQPGGSLDMWSRNRENAEHVPAASLLAALRNPRVVAFVVVWFGLNLLFGLGSLPLGGSAGQAVAWEAHVGGFFAGLLLFSAFDPPWRALPHDDSAPHDESTLH
jgi:membrane associated rhomboid family serine protease